MTVVVLMGVAGAGKSTVGRALARELGWLFHDADDDHPEVNRAKMARGEPLTAADRAPWARALGARARAWLAEGRDAVLACSALTAAVRAELSGGDPRVRFVHLTGPKELLRERLARRRGHYFPASLLDSQLAALEPADGAAAFDTTPPPEAVAAEIRRALGL